MSVKERIIVTDPDPIFGKLNWDVFPSDPIVLVTLAVVGLLGAGLVGLLTYKRLWGYLWSEWFTTVDHKKLGAMYLIVAFVMLVRGFADAVLMRLHQANALSATGEGAGFLPPEHYDQIFTAHGVIMVFFVATPIVTGFWNLLTPLQIGARDVAFPFLNNLSFWLFMAAVILMNLSLGIGEFANGGWLVYTPLSGIELSPWVGVDYWIWSVQISGIATTLTIVNFITTILRMRAPGMTMMKMPVFTWCTFSACLIGAAIFPIFTVAIALLTLDRYFGTHFFTSDLGGNQMQWVNLVWAWGHPEVYLLVIPGFGAISEVVPVFSRKRIFGYVGLVYATVCISIMSMLVWLHHFFTMGAGGSVNAFFGIATMAIAIPTGVKIFNWLFTMYKGRVQFTAHMAWVVVFLITFTIGGMTGVMLSIPAADFVLHNTLFLIAHFHNTIIGGAVFGYFAGVTFWWPKMTGFKLNDKIGIWSAILWCVGYFTAFVPIYLVGFMGATRRLNHYSDPDWQPFFIFAAFGVGVIGLAVATQVWNFYYSFRNRNKPEYKDVTGDPWDGRTMEWATSSPPAFYNFAKIPYFNERDEFWFRKQNDVAYVEPEEYERIHMPSNSWGGPVIGGFVTMFGFAFIWHIWWMVILGFVGTIAAWILHSFRKNKDYYVEAEEVKAIEAEHRKSLESIYGKNMTGAVIEEKLKALRQ